MGRVEGDRLLARVDNVEFVSGLMKFHTPLMQAFILEGVKKYCETLLEHKDEYIKQNKYSALSPVDWVGCAELFTKKYEEHLNQ